VRYRYHLRAASGRTSELEADAQERGTLEKIVAAIRALRSFSGEEVFIESEMLGPEHISGPLNRVIAEIDAARKAGAK